MVGTASNSVNVRVVAYLPEYQVEGIDSIAHKRGNSRSEIMRRWFDRMLGIPENQQ